MHEILEKLGRELADGTAGLSANETQVRRAADKWNIQQIVEHLTLSYQTTADAVALRVAKGTPTKAAPSLQQCLGQFMITTCGIFPKGRLAPPVVSPGESALHRLTGDELSGLVGESLLRMDGALAEAETLFGASQRAISHIVLGPMSVSQWRRFHLTHARHHVKQIAETRRLIAGARNTPA